jgi:hypothetical protein
MVANISIEGDNNLSYTFRTLSKLCKVSRSGIFSCFCVASVLPTEEGAFK